MVVSSSGLISAPSTPVRTDAPPSPFSDATPTPILPIGEVLSDSSPALQAPKRKAAAIKQEPVRSKKPKVEPTLKLESQSDVTASAAPAVIVESGPVAYAPEGTRSTIQWAVSPVIDFIKITFTCTFHVNCVQRQ